MCATTHCACCRGNLEPRQTLIQLRSADGLTSDKLTAVPYGTREWRTAAALPLTRVTPLAETIDPRPSANMIERRYRFNGRTVYDAGREVLVFEEVIETPPKPKYRVCESARGQWCSGCRSTHTSVAPRIVSGK